MLMHSVRHDWPEKAGFLISRPDGWPEYTFLHFLTPMNIRLNGTLFTAKAGACILFSPETPQYFYSNQSVLHNWIHFYDTVAPKLEQYNIPLNTLLYPKDDSFISRLLGMLEMEYYSDGSHREEICDCLCEEFLIRFSRAIKGEQLVQPADKAERQRLKEIRRHILSHPEERWSVAKMAALMPLSSSRFHAVYKTLFGSSPMQDVIEAKVSHAKSLLLSQPDLAVSQIAERLGYNDQYHFIRQFKATTGITPGQYRKIQGEK